MFFCIIDCGIVKAVVSTHQPAFNNKNKLNKTLSDRRIKEQHSLASKAKKYTLPMNKYIT